MTVALLAMALLVSGAGPQTGPRDQAEAFARAWVERDGGALRGAMATGGILLHLPGEEHALLRPRQAEAALMTFLERYAPGRTELTRLSPAGEDQDQAFAEIMWETGSTGITEPVIFTLFLAYSLGDEGWTVTEIRVLF